MSNQLKGVLLFALGMLVGAIGTKKFMEDKLEDAIQEELDSITRANREAAACRETGDKRRNDIDEVVTEMSRYRGQVCRYNGENEPDPSEIEEPRHEREAQFECERMSRTDYDGDGRPCPISIEQFSEEKDHFDKLTIYYYAVDDTLCDDEEAIVSDPVGLIGNEALRDLGDLDNHGQCVYVRNERISTDYEIIWMDKSYAETAVEGS